MTVQELVGDWFEKWNDGNYPELPISDNFRHTSPFGTIEGKKEYLELVKMNEDKFLGYHFNIHDKIFNGNKGCVRYTAVQGDFELDVSEWYYINNGLIESIVAYYHIGEIQDDRKLVEIDEN